MSLENSINWVTAMYLHEEDKAKLSSTGLLTMWRVIHYCLHYIQPKKYNNLLFDLYLSLQLSTYMQSLHFFSKFGSWSSPSDKCLKCGYIIQKNFPITSISHFDLISSSNSFAVMSSLIKSIFLFCISKNFLKNFVIFSSFWDAWKKRESILSNI